MQPKEYVLKDWFKRATNQQPRELTIDELIVLERYDEAEKALLARVKKNSRDVHSRIKLAGVYAHGRKTAKASEEYVLAAELHAQDGFHDKALALLANAQKLSPMDDAIPHKIERLRQAKKMERTRGLAVSALRQASGAVGTATAGVELEQMWERLSKTEFVQQLPPEQIKSLFGASSIQKLAAGDVLAQAGATQPELHIIASGTVEAMITSGDRDVTIRSFGSGDIIGEGALLEHQPWPATYKVTADLATLRLTRDSLQQAMTGNPDPRELLDALRRQHNDRDVVASLKQFG